MAYGDHVLPSFLAVTLGIDRALAHFAHLPSRQLRPLLQLRTIHLQRLEINQRNRHPRSDRLLHIARHDSLGLP